MRPVVVKPLRFFSPRAHLHRCREIDSSFGISAAAFFDGERGSEYALVQRRRLRAGGFILRERWLSRLLLSVSVRGTEHQNLIGEAWERAPLLELGVHLSEPVQSSGARTSSWVALRRPPASCCQPSIGFSCAPSGTTPVSRYRHNAINSLRASATIPIRRRRFPLPPKRRWYHWARALWG